MTVRNIQRFSTVELQQYNGFYRWGGDWPYALYDLFRGYCQGGFCDKKDADGKRIKLERRHGVGFQMGHFWPRSQPEKFKKIWPGLDVDNLMNMVLLCPKCNGYTSAEILPVDSILMAEAWKRILRRIRLKWPKIKERVNGNTLSCDVRDKLTFLLEFSLLPEDVYRYDGYVAIAVRDVASRLLPQIGGRFDVLEVVEHNIASILSGWEGYIYHSATSMICPPSRESLNNFSEFTDGNWREAWRHRCPELYQRLLRDKFLNSAIDEDDCFIKAGLKPFLLIMEPDGGSLMNSKQLPLSTYGTNYVYELLTIVEGLTRAICRKKFKAVTLTYQDLSSYEIAMLNWLYECWGDERDFMGLISCDLDGCYAAEPPPGIEQAEFDLCGNADEIVALMLRPEARALKKALENFLHSLLMVDKDHALFLSEIASGRFSLIWDYQQKKPWTIEKYQRYSHYWNRSISNVCRRHNLLLDAVPEKWSQWLLPSNVDSAAI